MKSGWSVFIAILLLLSVCSSVTAAEPIAYRVTIDGNNMNTSLAPQIKNGTTYVPMLPLFEALNTKISIDNKTKEIVGKRGSKTFKLTVGSKNAMLNGAKIVLSQPPLMIKGNVYVPIQLANRLLGAEIETKVSAKTINVRSIAIDLTITEKLPINNDGNEPITLQHPGNVKLKWWFKDESPHQRYTGYVGPNRTLIFKGFGDRIDTDYNGHKLYEDAYQRESSYSFQARIGAKGYDIIAQKDKDIHKWSGISLYLGSNVSTTFIIDGEPSYDLLNIKAGIDVYGNLIVLTTEGLAAYNPAGKQLWVRREWPTKNGTLSAFEAGLSVSDYSENRLYIQNFAGYAIVDSKGEAVFAANDYFHPEITSDELMLFNDSSYRLVDGQLKLVGSSYSDGTTGNYVSLEKENSLKRMDLTGKKPLWIYEQPLKEKSKGYSLFSELVVDLDGNAYISTTGGTVHSLDQAGNLRFVLHVDNGSISSTQIIPLSSTTFVAIDKNNVMCFEVTK
ncbi:copper amine oxidase N-terminal domain-containing protein [Cohnella abietis]|uniref:Copper amine oxidase-like N-terminal domain-containing protein n=1 Tax=Cohnella abietis TaxID=2507935 RepID=A0A3T1CY98_9BACL|nr:copper amine oxidase N-terminal domain-containing protein [Cohnella abietis]BBI30823.1 hypothetical protein KCTCHS21_02220 [Cohnella abietis]